MDPRTKNIREMKVDTGTAVDVRESTMLKGEAKDSLSGKNVTVQYDTQGGAGKGPWGGEASGD
jgi:hypothetical protein